MAYYRDYYLLFIYQINLYRFFHKASELQLMIFIRLCVCVIGVFPS